MYSSANGSYCVLHLSSGSQRYLTDPAIPAQRKRQCLKYLLQTIMYLTLKYASGCLHFFRRALKKTQKTKPERLPALWRSCLCWNRLCELVIGLSEPKRHEGAHSRHRCHTQHFCSHPLPCPAVGSYDRDMWSPSHSTLSGLSLLYLSPVSTDPSAMLPSFCSIAKCWRRGHTKTWLVRGCPFVGKALKS